MPIEQEKWLSELNLHRENDFQGMLFWPAGGQQVYSVTDERSAVFYRSDTEGQMLAGGSFHPHARKSEIKGEMLAGNSCFRIQFPSHILMENYLPGNGMRTLY